MGEVSDLLDGVYRGDHARVDGLLASGRELDVFEAAALGRCERLRELLATEAALARAVAPDGFTALHLVAFFSGDVECARVLLGAGADVSAPALNAMEVTPLNSAAARGRHAVAQLLLDRGADVHASQHGGYSALHSAAANGDVALAELLLERGADPSRAAEDGRLPADLAAERGHPELAARLGAAPTPP